VRVLVVLVGVFLVNLPAAHQAWTDRQLAADGVDVEATVLHARTVSGRHLVDYRLPEEVDPAGNRFSASLAAGTFARAEASHRLAVRVIPGRPGANRPEGEESSPIFLVAAIGADAILLLIGAAWLFRRRPGGPPTGEPAGTG
jgi:hypothetical protein